MSFLSALKSFAAGAAGLVATPATDNRPKLYLSAGHSNVPGQDRGAQAPHYVDASSQHGPQPVVFEGDLTVQLRRAIYDKLVAKGYKDRIVIDVDSNITKDTYNYFVKTIRPQDIALDIHFNAATPAATGVEVLVPDKYTTKEASMAGELAAVTKRVLGIPFRGGVIVNKATIPGVKTESMSARGGLLWMKFKAETILWEVMFISNPDNQKVYFEKFDTLATEAAELIAKWLN